MSFKPRLRLFPLAGILLALGFGFLCREARAWRQGPPPDRVGACGFAPTCREAGCHNSYPIGSATLVWDFIQESPNPGPLPPAYVPGGTYGFRLQLSDSDVDAVIWGFELAALTDCPVWETAGNMVPSNPNRVRTFQGERNILFLSHSCTCPGEEPSCCGYQPEGIPVENGWSFLWTAPERGSGEVRFYFSINAANRNREPTGDRIVLGTVSLPEETCTDPLVRDLRVQSSRDCDGGQPGIDLLWAQAAGDIVRKTFDLADLSLDRSQWMDAGGACQPEDAGVQLVFYSVARTCDLGGEAH